MQEKEELEEQRAGWTILAWLWLTVHIPHLVSFWEAKRVHCWIRKQRVYCEAAELPHELKKL